MTKPYCTDLNSRSDFRTNYERLSYSVGTKRKMKLMLRCIQQIDNANVKMKTKTTGFSFDIPLL